MMIALTQSEEYILAQDIDTEYLGDLRCPSCRQKVFFKQGNTKISHFSHYSKKECDTFSEGETAEHLAGKLQLYQLFKEKGFTAELEAYLTELKQRPDILLYLNGKKVAVEFQCSKLSIERMVERTKNYNRYGYDVYWILGKNLIQSAQLTQLHKSFLRYTENFSLYLLYYSVARETIHLIYQIGFSSKKWVYRERVLTDWELMEVFKNTLDKKLEAAIVSKEPINYKKLHKEILRLSYYAQQNIRAFCQELYLNQESLSSMPVELYLPVQNEWLIKTVSFEWKYKILIWIETFSNNRIITKKMINMYLDTQLNEHKIIFETCPLIDDRIYYQVVYDYLDLLAKRRVVKKHNGEKWSLLAKARRFNTERDKLTKLEELTTNRGKR